MDKNSVVLVNTLLSRRASTGGEVDSRELKRCSLDLDRECMVIDFNIASAGGGQTHINIRYSIEDMVNVLNQYMDAKPGEILFEARLVPPKRHKIRWNPFEGKEVLIEK